MDNFTHTLTGIALSQAGLKRKTRFATLALVLASNAPDVDVVTRIRGSASYLEYHRGITHSFAGLAGLALMLTALIYLPGRRARPKPSSPPLNLRWLFLACSTGLLGHLLLDFTNAYGVRPFMPVSGRWFAWDIMPILDPMLLLLLAAGLGLPFLLRLVSEEVGAGRPGYRRGAVVALVGLVLLWGVRDFCHRRALSLLASNNYAEEPPLRLGAFPTLNPLDWVGVVETDSAFHVLPANSLAADVDPGQAEVFRKPEPSPALNAAVASHVGRVFMDFARFPFARVETQPEGGWEVIIRDLRFGRASGSVGSFEATIDLGPNLQVVGQTFSFMGRPSP
ncbi:MAG TPA: metal-dependent hydrolase [Terriglobia bacterium]|nr:metal-dependent hydrolase [Terriglobia bacterium]